MRTTRKQLFIGLPVLIAIGLAAFFGLWAWGGVGIGVGDTFGIKGSVEYTVYDANGLIRLHSVHPNVAFNEPFRFDAKSRLGVVNTGTATGAALVEADLYNNIALCSNDANAALGVGGTPVACTLTTPANVSDGNPRNATGTATTAGVYTTTATFTFTGAGTIEELQLCKGTLTVTNGVSGTACVGGTASATGQIGAFQNIGTITMANTDSIAITWTITVN